MNKEDKQRAIGKVVAINSDRFTIELLSGIDNFNVNGFDDIHYFAQLNSYVIVPYQNYYIVAEVSGVREKDLNVPFSNPTEQILSKVKSGKFLEVLPIGTLKPKEGEPNVYDFDFGVSVYPALYTDTLYIKEAELDAIFNVKNQEQIVCAKPKEHKTECDCKTKRYKTLSIGKSTIFPDYEVKIDIDKFFSSHSAILGNTGSGKSCTIASMLQNLYRLNGYSATGSSFIIFDVNGEYRQAFSEIQNVNLDLEVKNFSIDPAEVNAEVKQFVLPHWFLTIDEWALLLQATEKTQLPILRNALGLASIFTLQIDVNELKNHILATCITQILRDESSSPSKKDRIVSILQKFNTNEISLAKEFTYNDDEGNEQSTVYIDRGINLVCNIRNCLTVHFGEIKGIRQLISYLEQTNEDGEPVFIVDKFKMPTYERNQKFSFEIIEDALDLAILYEEAHGNKQIRDYCSSLITRLKSIKDRGDFNFLKQDNANFEQYKRSLLGLSKVKSANEVTKKQQIIILDLSSVEDEIVEVISCVISRIIYEAVKEIPPRNSYPVNLILEEAHRYISDSPVGAFLKANRIFELIAKEGRKFGMLLMISSQRPSALSKTVLSQCSNFIVHRIQNPEDLAHIRQITPHISDTILKRMPSIPTQHALIFGHAVNLPTTFKVNEAKPRPKSDNNNISENWFKPKNHIVYKYE
ncbi:ATP-binding protein [Mesoflavibacter zeaxanthinifaciens]|uniref:ATP-binding protein n=1 Tax=Mesoflavibacter zeaxanthinifaciens TaxID=393060 RepID=UPI003A9235F6